MTLPGLVSSEVATRALSSFSVASPHTTSRPPASCSRTRVGASARSSTSLLRSSLVSEASTASAAWVAGSSGPGAARRNSARSAGRAGTAVKTTPLSSSTPKPAGWATTARPARSCTRTTRVSGHARLAVARRTGSSRPTRRPTASRSTRASGVPGATPAAARTESGVTRCAPTTRIRATPSNGVANTTTAPAATSTTKTSATNQGRAARSRRCRARAMNSRTDGGAASWRARTSRQRRPPTAGPSRSVMPRPSRPGGRQRGEQLVAHERDRRRAHRHHDVTTPGPPYDLLRHVLPGGHEHLAGARQVHRGRQRHPALARLAYLPRAEDLQDHHLGDRERRGDLGLHVPGPVDPVGLEHHDQPAGGRDLAKRLQRRGHRGRVVGVLVVDPYAGGHPLELEATPYARKRRQRLHHRLERDAQPQRGEHRRRRVEAEVAPWHW